MIALVDPEHDDGAGLARRRCDEIGLRPRRSDGVLIKPDVLRPALHRRRDEGEIGIPGHEGLGKDDDLRPFRRRVGDRGQHALQGRRA